DRLATRRNKRRGGTTDSKRFRAEFHCRGHDERRCGESGGGGERLGSAGVVPACCSCRPRLQEWRDGRLTRPAGEDARRSARRFGFDVEARPIEASYGFIP